jgi:ketosteroid isomerase-like protein
VVVEGNLQIVRQGYEVLNRGEVDRFLTGFVHPEYEFHTGVQVPSIPTVVRGRDGLRAWIQQWYQEPWQGQLQMEVERMDELDDGRVLALLTLRASGRGRGARVETEYAHIITCSRRAAHAAVPSSFSYITQPSAGAIPARS